MLCHSWILVIKFYILLLVKRLQPDLQLLLNWSLSQWMSEWGIAKWAICQVYHGDNMLHLTKWWRFCFVPDQIAQFHFYCAPIWRIILIPDQPVFPLPPWYCALSGEPTKTNFIVFGLRRPCRSITRDLAYSIQGTITLPMRFKLVFVVRYVFDVSQLYKYESENANIGQLTQ